MWWIRRNGCGNYKTDTTINATTMIIVIKISSFDWSKPNPNDSMVNVRIVITNWCKLLRAIDNWDYQSFSCECKSFDSCSFQINCAYSHLNDTSTRTTTNNWTEKKKQTANRLSTIYFHFRTCSHTQKKAKCATLLWTDTFFFNHCCCCCYCHWIDFSSNFLCNKLNIS